MNNITPYRGSNHCSNCDELQQELDSLKGNNIYPFQTASKAKCLKCNFTLFIEGNMKGFFTKKSNKDLKYCKGKKGWFKKPCPQFEHIHRHCNVIVMSVMQHGSNIH